MATQQGRELTAGEQQKQSGLGLSFSTLPPDEPVVANVTPGGWAASRHIRRGDRVLRIADRSVDAMDAEQFKTLSQTFPVVFRVARAGRIVTANQADKDLGLGFSALPPAATIISKVTKDSWAEREGLKVGDEIVEVNGQVPEEITADSFKAATSSRPLTLVVQQQAASEEGPGTAAAEEERKDISERLLVAGPEVVEGLGLGFSAVPPQQPLVISKVTPKTWAASVGIQVGDEVVEVNGQTASSLTPDSFKQAMEQRPVTFKVRRQDTVSDETSGDADADRGRAATRIQAAHRGKAERQRHKERQGHAGQPASDQAEDVRQSADSHSGPAADEREQAATRIQAAQRGKAVRSKQKDTSSKTTPPSATHNPSSGQLQKELEGGSSADLEAEREKAATRIQATHRGNAARRHQKNSQSDQHRQSTVANAGTLGQSPQGSVPHPHSAEDAEREKAATRIQAAQRGKAVRGANKNGRSNDAEQRTASQAASPQSQSHETDADHAEREKAATRIQAAQRGKAVRRGNKKSQSTDAEPRADSQAASSQSQGRQDADHDEREKAATRIQAAQRGKAVRKANRTGQSNDAEPRTSSQTPSSQSQRRQDADDDEREKAATRIQAAQRGKAVRKGDKKGQSNDAEPRVASQAASPQSQSHDADHAEREKAATRIQAAQRGKQVRKGNKKGQSNDAEPRVASQAASPQSQSHDADHAEREKAATRIQAAQRGKAVRKGNKQGQSKDAGPRTDSQAASSQSQSRHDAAHDEREKAATRIQAVQRGKAVRQRGKGQQAEAAGAGRQDDLDSRRQTEEAVLEAGVEVPDGEDGFEDVTDSATASAIAVSSASLRSQQHVSFAERMPAGRDTVVSLPSWADESMLRAEDDDSPVSYQRKSQRDESGLEEDLQQLAMDHSGDEEDEKRRREAAALSIQTAQRAKRDRQRAAEKRQKKEAKWKKVLTQSITAGLDVQSLGLGFSSMPPDKVIISGVFAGSWAERQGCVQRGDELVEVNAKSVRDMTLEAFRSALHPDNRPVIFRLIDNSAQRHGSATQIQAALRGYLVRKWYYPIKNEKERQRAAVTIQAGERGRRARQALRQRNDELAGAATLIQKLFRGNKGREKHRRAKAEKGAAATKLQKAYRQHAEREKRRKEREGAAVKIQCGWKQKAARQEVARRKQLLSNAALTIQKMFRKHKERQRIKKEQSDAALAIQPAARGYLARKEYKRKVAARLAAATKVQAFFRGRRTRSRLKAEAEERNRQQAATKIQSVQRGKATRKRLENEKLSRAAAKIQAVALLFIRRKRVQAAKELKQRNEAASKIQAAQKGRVMRQRMKNMKEVTQRTLAAIEIQAAARLLFARRRQKRNEAAVKLQAGGRGMLGRRKAHEREAYLAEVARTKVAAATAIQRVARGREGRKRAEERKVEVAKRNSAATKIQAIHRARACRKAFARRRQAAIDIQRVARGAQGRTRFDASASAKAAADRGFYRGRPLRRKQRSTRVEDRSCPTCSKTLDWSDYHGPEYQFGWQCNNAERCFHDKETDGAFRWHCDSCLNDYCDYCRLCHEINGPTESDLEEIRQEKLAELDEEMRTGRKPRRQGKPSGITVLWMHQKKRRLRTDQDVSLWVQTRYRHFLVLLKVLQHRQKKEALLRIQCHYRGVREQRNAFDKISRRNELREASQFVNNRYRANQARADGAQRKQKKQEQDDAAKIIQSRIRTKQLKENEVAERRRKKRDQERAEHDATMWMQTKYRGNASKAAAEQAAAFRKREREELDRACLWIQTRWRGKQMQKFAAPILADVREKQAEVNRRLWVRCPNDNYHDPISGIYFKQQGRSANGWPIWRQDGGGDHVIYAGAGGHWFIGGWAEERQDFQCDSGVVASVETHNMTLRPWELEKGWVMFHNGQWLSVAASFELTAEPWKSGCRASIVSLKLKNGLDYLRNAGQVDVYAVARIKDKPEYKSLVTDVGSISASPFWDTQKQFRKCHCKVDAWVFEVYCRHRGTATTPPRDELLGQQVIEPEQYFPLGYRGSLKIDLGALNNKPGLAICSLQVRLMVLGEPRPNRMMVAPELREEIKHFLANRLADTDDELTRYTEKVFQEQTIEAWQMVYRVRVNFEVPVEKVPDYRIEELVEVLACDEKRSPKQERRVPCMTLAKLQEWLTWKWIPDGVEPNPWSSLGFQLTETLTRLQGLVREALQIEMPPDHKERRLEWLKSSVPKFLAAFDVDKQGVDGKVSSHDFLFAWRSELGIADEEASDHQIQSLFTKLRRPENLYEDTAAVQIADIIGFADITLKDSLDDLREHEAEYAHAEAVTQAHHQIRAHRGWGNGALSVTRKLIHRREAVAWLRRQRGIMNEQDESGDGYITQDEYIAFHSRRGVSKDVLAQVFQLVAKDAKRFEGEWTENLSVSIDALLNYDLEITGRSEFVKSDASPSTVFAQQGTTKGTDSTKSRSRTGQATLQRLRTELLKLAPSICCAWRQVLDPQWKMKLPMHDFYTIVRRFVGDADDIKHMWAEIDPDATGLVTVCQLDFPTSEVLSRFYAELLRAYGSLSNAAVTLGLKRGLKLHKLDFLKRMRDGRHLSRPEAEQVFDMLCNEQLGHAAVTDKEFEWFEKLVAVLIQPSLQRQVPGDLESKVPAEQSRSHGWQDFDIEYQMYGPANGQDSGECFGRLYDAALALQDRKQERQERSLRQQQVERPDKSEADLSWTFERLHLDSNRRHRMLSERAQVRHEEFAQLADDKHARPADPEIFARLVAPRLAPSTSVPAHHAISPPRQQRTLSPEDVERIVTRHHNEHERRKKRREETADRKEAELKKEMEMLVKKYHDPENFNEQRFEHLFKEDSVRTARRNKYLERTAEKAKEKYEAEQRRFRRSISPHLHHRLHLAGSDKEFQRKAQKDAEERLLLSKLSAESVHGHRTFNDGSVFTRLHGNEKARRVESDVFDFETTSLTDLTADTPWLQPEQDLPPDPVQPAPKAEPEKGKGAADGGGKGKGKAAAGGGAARGTMAGGGGGKAKGGGGAARGTMVGGGGKGKAS
eukprot:TRINITY_DN2641_c0_g1_i11.p1 TRINITY_DN2641_c0_g1~~TRINITY_DN2641_c0_g1_i11.p1  ORF type:complete len:3027 (-),score=659.15 TRINITY_DN2641_c0_g1_i11:545-9625(-)